MATVQDLLPEVRRYVKNCPDLTLLYALRRAVQLFARESWIYQKTMYLPLINNQDNYTITLLSDDELLEVLGAQWNNISPSTPALGTSTLNGSVSLNALTAVLAAGPTPSVGMVLSFNDNAYEYATIIAVSGQTITFSAGLKSAHLSGAAVSWANPSVSGRPLAARRQEDVYFQQSGNEPLVYVFEPPNILLLRPIPQDVGNKQCLVRVALQPKDDTDAIPEIIYREYKTKVAAGAASYCLLMPEEVWSDPKTGMKLEQEFMYGYTNARNMRERGFVSRNVRVRPRSFLNS